MYCQGRVNTAKITEVVLGSEDRLAAQMSEMMAKMEAIRIASMYASIGDKTKNNAAHKAMSLDIESLTLVKGKKGKLGRGSHGLVKVSRTVLCDQKVNHTAALRHTAPRRATPRHVSQRFNSTQRITTQTQHQTPPWAHSSASTILAMGAPRCRWQSR